MPGHTIETDLEAKRLFKLARREAEELGFATDATGDFAFNARMGNLFLSILLGAMIAYCDFDVEIEEDDDGTVELSVKRNSPWWTGWLGMNRVKSRAKELAKNIASAIEDDNGEVLHESTF